MGSKRNRHPHGRPCSPERLYQKCEKPWGSHCGQELSLDFRQDIFSRYNGPALTMLFHIVGIENAVEDRLK